MRTISGWARCFVILGFSCHSILAQTSPPANFGTQTQASNIATQGVTTTQPTATNPLKKADEKIDFRKDAPLWVSNLIALVALIVAAVNLWIVIHFFYRANYDRTQERVEDRNERDVRMGREVGNFWIQELILKTNNETLHRFFDTYENLIADFHKKCEASAEGVESLSKNAGELVRQFKQEFHVIDKRIIQPLEWVNADFNQLRPILSDIEDLVTEEFATIRLEVQKKPEDKTRETPEMKFRNLRRDFFRCLHERHKSFVGLKYDGPNQA